MNGMIELLFSEWIDVFGWTLIHSLWQGLLILLAVLLCVRLLAANRSAVRYSIACAGLLLFVATSLTTFFYLGHYASTSAVTLIHDGAQELYVVSSYTTPSSVSGILSMIGEAIQQNMMVIVGLWAAGFLFFGFRLSSGLLYTLRMRATSVPVSNEWNAFIADAARKLGIARLVALAESASITAPMVIGYFKPVILIPMGMLTGLSSEQLETIFVHELAHIKRHDYLVNLLQSVIESIFFFNPFVRVLSNIIRTEREYCCDDFVIRYHGGNRAYAQALVQLAEATLRSAGFALSLAEDKNQLLNRIKRIMENSVKTYSGKGRFVIPVVLLLGGLLCISWLGSEGNDSSSATARLTPQDTIPGKTKNSARYSRKSIIVMDENGQPHEEIVEEFEGDESLRPLLEDQIPDISDFPSIPDISDFPSLPHLPVDPMLPDFDLPLAPDTIPFSFRNMDGWEDFARSFHDNFRKRFEMLDRFHEGDTADFMKHFRHNFKWPDWDSLGISDHAFDALRELKGSYQDLDNDLERLRDLKMEHFRDMEEQFNHRGDRLRGYERVLRDHLVEDGYLSEDEPIQSLEWNNETFKVNGKVIKESDREKYNKLNSEYLGGSKKLNKNKVQ